VALLALEEVIFSRAHEPLSGYDELVVEQKGHAH
jgi:hypothetical protein